MQIVSSCDVRVKSQDGAMFLPFRSDMVLSMPSTSYLSYQPSSVKCHDATIEWLYSHFVVACCHVIPIYTRTLRMFYLDSDSKTWARIKVWNRLISGGLSSNNVAMLPNSSASMLAKSLGVK